MADASETAKALTAAWIGTGVPSKNAKEVVEGSTTAFTMSLVPRRRITGAQQIRACGLISTIRHHCEY